VLLLVLFPGSVAPSKRQENTDLAFWYRFLSLAGALGASLVFLIVMDHSSSSYGHRLGTLELLGVGLLYGLSLLVAGVCWYRNRAKPSLAMWDGMFLGGAVTLGVAISLLVICKLPLNPQLSDTLPWIQAGIENLLRGENPYQAYDLGPGTNPHPLNYLPMMWLPYVPFVAAGVDLRLLGILALLWIIVIIRRSTRDSDVTWVPVMITVVLSPFFAPRAGLYEYAYWLFLVLSYREMYREQWYRASILWGLSLAAQKIVLFLMPFYAILLWKKRGPWGAAKHIGLVALVAITILAPFALWSPSGFVYGSFSFHQQQINLPVSLHKALALLEGFSLVPILRSLDLSHCLQAVQVAFLVLLSYLAVSRVRSVVDSLRFMALSYTIFLMLNPICWTYLYSPVILTAIFALIGWTRHSQSHPDPQHAHQLSIRVARVPASGRSSLIGQVHEPQCTTDIDRLPPGGPRGVHGLYTAHDTHPGPVGV
jgi:hypothetical protein